MTLNVAFMIQYFGSKAARSIFQESIAVFKDYNINKDIIPPNILIMLQCFHCGKEKKKTCRIFFSQRRWLFKNQQRIQLHVLCVFAVCVCVIFFDCINTSQSNMTYQLFHRVLLLLHSSHKRRGLLLCGTHILLLVVIIQDAQWRLKGRKDN